MKKGKKLDKKNPHIKKRIAENPKVDFKAFNIVIEESTKHQPFDKEKD